MGTWGYKGRIGSQAGKMERRWLGEQRSVLADGDGGDDGKRR